MESKTKTEMLRRSGVVTKALAQINPRDMIDAKTAGDVERVIERARISAIESLGVPGLTHYGFGSWLQFTADSVSGESIPSSGKNGNILRLDNPAVVYTWGLDDGQRPLYDLIARNIRVHWVFRAFGGTGGGFYAEAQEAIHRICRAQLVFGSRDLQHFELPLGDAVDTALAMCQMNNVTTTVEEPGTVVRDHIDGRRGYELEGYDTLTMLDPVYMYLRDPLDADNVFGLPTTGAADYEFELALSISVEGVRRD